MPVAEMISGTIIGEIKIAIIARFAGTWLWLSPIAANVPSDTDTKVAMGAHRHRARVTEPTHPTIKISFFIAHRRHFKATVVNHSSAVRGVVVPLAAARPPRHIAPHVRLTRARRRGQAMSRLSRALRQARSAPMRSRRVFMVHSLQHEFSR